MAYFKVKAPQLERRERWLKRHLVVYPVSYTYNGGIIVDGDWYEGFEVDPPIVPEGFELVDIGVGLDMNNKPPLATNYLRPKE